MLFSIYAKTLRSLRSPIRRFVWSLGRLATLGKKFHPVFVGWKKSWYKCAIEPWRQQHTRSNHKPYQMTQHDKAQGASDPTHIETGTWGCSKLTLSTIIRETYVVGSYHQTFKNDYQLTHWIVFNHKLTSQGSCTWFLSEGKDPHPRAPKSSEIHFRCIGIRFKAKRHFVYLPCCNIRTNIPDLDENSNPPVCHLLWPLHVKIVQKTEY